MNLALKSQVPTKFQIQTFIVYCESFSFEMPSVNDVVLGTAKQGWGQLLGLRKKLNELSKWQMNGYQVAFESASRTLFIESK